MTISLAYAALALGWVVCFLLALILSVVRYYKNLFTQEQIETLVIAYEPIWAIGTGKTASAQDANEVCAWVREEIRNLFGDVAEEVIIQYGGSVKSSNATELFGMSDIDGGLVGGASLDPEEFSKIVNYNK